MNDPENPNSDCLNTIELNVISKIKSCLEDQNDKIIRKCMKWVEKRSHPRLWKEIANGALQQENYEIAEIAFINSNDYAGLKLVSMLRQISDENVRKGEICSFLGKFRDAEGHYSASDRKSVAYRV
jgi:WD repeat-containing protein 35